MSLISRTSDTHSHLARKIVRKHNGLHTVTPTVRPVTEADASKAKRQAPFGELRFGSEKDMVPPAYKSILDL